CSLSLDSMNLMEREAHVNQCCEDRESCDVVSISSTETTERYDHSATNPALLHPAQCEQKSLSSYSISNNNFEIVHDRVEISPNFLDCLKTSSDSTCRHLSSEKGSDAKDENRQINRANISHEFNTLLKECQTDVPRCSFPGTSTGSESDDGVDGELTFFRNRRIGQTDLLRRLKASGKISGLGSGVTCCF
ncbi:hypothetical protein BVRB_038260, partial [Beta vulgaris subsp. vulgaris]